MPFRQSSLLPPTAYPFLQTCEELKKEGIDILAVREIAPGASDEKVIQIAKKHERILLTFDKDFGKRVFKQKMVAKGVILLRIPPMSPSMISENIKKLLLRNDIKLEGHFTVVEVDKIRSIPLKRP
jgi:predicted nuclease of predicted toxin-antitoxin system